MLGLYVMQRIDGPALVILHSLDEVEQDLGLL